VEEAKAAARLPGGSQLHGQWLQKQRAAHKLTPEALAKHLPATVADIRQVEARSWPLPSEWFPILKTLFTRTKKSPSKRTVAAVPLAETPTETKTKTKAKTKTEAKVKPEAKKPRAKPAVTVTATKPPAPASAKPSAKRPAKTSAKAVESVAAAPKSVEEASAKAAAADLSEMIVSYRLTLGQHAGIPAVTVLAQIASDLQLAKGREAISYPALRAALKTLLRG
jgi:hypothetical protein